MRHMRFILAALLMAVVWTPVVLGGANTAPASPSSPATRPADSDSIPQFWFGVAVENIPPNIALQLKLKPNQGLMVFAVLADSPAQQAGLKADDILVEIDGRPLTSQDELAATASVRARKGQPPKPYRIAFLREGDLKSLEITPAPRPPNMLVFGPDKPRNSRFQNIALPNGGVAQVGPGYRVDLTTPGGLTVKSIKSIVSKGQTIILTQETDTTGTVKNTITVGDVSYAVDPQHLDALPAELQPFAEQLIAGAPTQGQPSASRPAASSSLEQQVKLLQRQNDELQKQVQELAEKIQKAHDSSQ